MNTANAKGFMLQVVTESGRSYVIMSKPEEPGAFHVLIFNAEGTICENIPKARIEWSGTAKGAPYVACGPELRELEAGVALRIVSLDTSSGKTPNWKSTPATEVQRYE
jgi:hypothetical protein